MKNSNYFGKNRISGNFRQSGLKIMLGLFLCIMAQAPYAQSVIRLDQQIADMLASADPATVIAGHQLQSLTSDLHPAVFINEGILTFSEGEVPVIAEVDIASITTLYQPEPSFASVEIIIFRLNGPSDLLSVIDPGALTGFTSLKYLYFLCSFDVCPGYNQSQSCAENTLLPMLQGTGNGNLVILFKVSIPS